MTFLHLLDGVEVLSQSGNPGISGLEHDSRKVKPGSVFLAMRGETTDGNRYIEKPREGVAWALVPHGRRALARLSANFFGNPANRLSLTGITGTNGKSTTTFLVESILRAADRKCALVGTIEYHVADRILPAPHTTPESLELHQLFSEAVRAGVSEGVMEVSSHALAQQRVFGLAYDVAVFTNLTRDHLDYHHTMDEYFAAKRLLFEGSGAAYPRLAVINVDDEYGRTLVTTSRARGSKVMTYGLTAGDFHAEKLDITARGTRFDMATPGRVIPIWSPLIGRVNVYNVLAAAGAAWGRGCNSKQIAEGIAALSFVPGRFQRVDCGQPFTVVIDYAHTDDALRNLTSLSREFVRQNGGKGRVITVCGCGGDRDRTKRPLMGEAAGKGSDFVVLTSDNPRTEDPLAIINDALVGLQRSGAKYKVEPDRRAAIAMAIGEAMVGDIILLAGKGHEKVQITREGSRPFDDVEVAREVLRQSGYDCGSEQKTASIQAGKP
jgi:UDP-N-acetylmuramoyl-L-alanyl-D-glutamate--2,6-diaminopimelate ligase